MNTNSGAASTSRQSVRGHASADIPLKCSPFPTSMDQVPFVGRVIDNAGGSAERKLKPPWFGGVGSCSKRKPAPDTAGGRTASMVKHGPTNAVDAGTGIAYGLTCHVVRCEQAAFGHMEGYPTIPLCATHLKDNTRRLRSNANQIEGKSKALFKRKVCEYPECTKKPRYSPTKEGPARACKHHKKAGMFSTRNGQILYAIHDGDALRYSLSSSTNSPPIAEEETRRSSSAKGLEPRHSTPVDVARLKQSRSAEISGENWGALKREAAAATRSEGDTDSSASRSDQTTSTQRSHNLCDVTGMVPHVKMKVLQKEREKALAEASATGKRPRVPSRKVLEASGKLKNDGVQWMTKEMYKAGVELRKDLRERRKEEAAAKTKVDHKLDTLEVRIKVDDPVDLGRAEKSASGGCTGTEDVGIRGWESQSSSPISLERRTWWAVELPQAGGRRQVSYTLESKRKDNDGVPAEGSSRKRSRAGTE